MAFGSCSPYPIAAWPLGAVPWNFGPSHRLRGPGPGECPGSFDPEPKPTAVLALEVQVVGLVAALPVEVSAAPAWRLGLLTPWAGPTKG